MIEQDHKAITQRCAIFDATRSVHGTSSSAAAAAAAAATRDG